MSKPGPKPKPVEILKARGSREARVKQKELASLPELPELRQVDYPANLTVAARHYFDGICAHLESIGRLRGAFTPAMVELSHLLCDMDKLRAGQNRLDDPDLDIDMKDRVLLESRLLLQKDSVGKAILRLQREFYMTPASMEGVAVKKDQPKPVENQESKAALRKPKK